MTSLISSVLFIAIFWSGNSFAGTSKVDIEFKGKKSVRHTEVCSDPGTRLPLEDSLVQTLASMDVFIDYGQYQCYPNFSEYGGIKLIQKKNDGCDSKLDFDPRSGMISNLKISYDENSYSHILKILKEKYGSDKPGEIEWRDITVKTHEWKDDKKGRIRLTEVERVYIHRSDRIIPDVSRSCSILEIKTSAMHELTIKMKIEKKKKISKEIEIENNDLKSKANKL